MIKTSASLVSSPWLPEMVGWRNLQITPWLGDNAGSAFLPIKRFQVKITARVTLLCSTTAPLEPCKSPRSSLCRANTRCCFGRPSCAAVTAPFRALSGGAQLGWMCCGGKKGKSLQISNYVFLTVRFCFDLPDAGCTLRGGLCARPKSA